MKKTINGFTIVELLIVIVVIAILATISIVAYRGIQNRAYNASVQSDLKNIATKIELYKAEQGTYPLATGSVFATLGLSVTKSAYDTTRGMHSLVAYNLLYCTTADFSQFALIAKSKSGDAFQFAGGSVASYTGPILSSETQNMCAGAGITVVSGGFMWLYYDNAWRSWVAG